MPSKDPSKKPSKLPYLKRTVGLPRVCQRCGLTFHVPAWKEKAKYCSRACAQVGKAHSTARRAYADKIRGSGNGYVKRHNRHEHRIVAERTLGRPLLATEIVHHLDGDKKNNSPENLQIMSQSEHVRLHAKEVI